jgi:hypothetical protein
MGIAGIESAWSFGAGALLGRGGSWKFIKGARGAFKSKAAVFKESLLGLTKGQKFARVMQAGGKVISGLLQGPGLRALYKQMALFPITMLRFFGLL